MATATGMDNKKKYTELCLKYIRRPAAMFASFISIKACHSLELFSINPAFKSAGLCMKYVF